MASSSTPTPATIQDILSPSPPGQQNLFARLQAFFPTSANVSVQTKSAPPNIHRQTPLSFIKIRILTWNMHDAVPKGDLTDLLGAVSPYVPPPAAKEPAFPRLETNVGHPYHLIVVAGQECPTMSGFPMGLGAGLKLIDKEKDPVKDVLERNRSHPVPKHREKEKDEVVNHHKSVNDSHESLGHHHVGWTSMVEDWLCHAAGTSGPATSPAFGSEGAHSPTTRCPTPNESKDEGKDDQEGPYQLLTKERLMGIYMAIYIHRDIREFVQGTSKGSVAAGLIGGRVGNKGGVGISLNLNGITLLFINAHLAAHGSKQHHRLANLAKIKAELSLDAFLKPDDPRLVAEDITDRFDYTFFCGDLNFRLDISRLHADWLIARQEYAQALAFDQLQKLMEKGEAFVGFHEACINFPPTFKYDVMRTLKRKKASRDQPWNQADRPTHLIIEAEHEELEDDGLEDEAASIASSILTSNSRAETSGDDEYVQLHPSAHSVRTPGSRVSFAIAAGKAKAKWLELLSPTSPRNFFKLGSPRPPRTPSSRPHTPKLPTPNGTRNAFLAPTQVANGRSSSTPDFERQPLTYSISTPRANAAKQDQPIGESDTDDKGVYDSSNKQRVPSWCDRILWKSTLKSEPSVDGADVALLPRSRTLVGQFFALALRPLSARGRAASAGPVLSTDIQKTSPPSDMVQRSSTTPVTRPQTAVPPPKVKPMPQPDTVRQSHSNEDIHPKKPDVVTPSPVEINRTRRATLGVYLPTLSADLPERRAMDVVPAAAVRSAGLPNRSSTTRYASLPTPFRWRFLPFLSRDSTTVASSEPDTISEPISHPRRGDVVCLSYDTLDDRAMRRLEGRSDHRPVIGSYAVYI